MGIPGLGRTLEKSTNYRKYKTVQYELKESIDHLLFDFNGIVYTIEPTIKHKFKTGKSADYEKLLISEIIKYLQKVICVHIKPQKTVYIAIDGPVPRAKIYEQRKRRYKSLIEAKYKNEIKKKHNVPITNNWETSTHMIPGSAFMLKLEKAFKKAIKTKIFCGHKDIMVILSPGNVPGEGEHKLHPIIHKINKSKKMKNDKICIFSPDGDLIVLALVWGKNNTYLMDNFQDNNRIKHLYKFKFTSIDNYRTALSKYMRVNMDIEQFSVDFNLLMCFLGNDFVRGFVITPSKDTDVSLEKIIFPAYEGIYNRKKKPLQKLSKKKIIINHAFLTDLLESIGKNEDFRFKMFYKKQIENHMLGKYRGRNNKDNDKTEYEKDISILDHTPICSSKNIFLYKKYIADFRKIDYSLPYKKWRKQYYKSYFGFDIDSAKSRGKLVEIVNEYLKSILYVQKYYFFECPSWSWYYRYETSPLPSDIAHVMRREIPNINKISFELGTPYTPVQQMMFVMPLEYVNRLPKSKSFKKIMTGSKYKYLYPIKFDLEVTLGIKFIYGEVKLPPFNDDIIKDIEKIEDTFTGNSKTRNKLTYKLFKKDCAKIKNKK
jgi:5'-3' exonuclease